MGTADGTTKFGNFDDLTWLMTFVLERRDSSDERIYNLCRESPQWREVCLRDLAFPSLETSRAAQPVETLRRLHRLGVRTVKAKTLSFTKHGLNISEYPTYRPYNEIASTVNEPLEVLRPELLRSDFKVLRRILDLEMIREHQPKNQYQILSFVDWWLTDFSPTQLPCATCMSLSLWFFSVLSRKFHPAFLHSPGNHSFANMLGYRDIYTPLPCDRVFCKSDSQNVSSLLKKWAYEITLEMHFLEIWALVQHLIVHLSTGATERYPDPSWIRDSDLTYSMDVNTSETKVILPESWLHLVVNSVTPNAISGDCETFKSCWESHKYAAYQFSLPLKTGRLNFEVFCQYFAKFEKYLRAIVHT